jgi:hypothetical protein
MEEPDNYVEEFRRRDEPTITIYWSRHAESCANVGQGSIRDLPPEYNYADTKNHKYDELPDGIKSLSRDTNYGKSINPVSKAKAAMYYHPNLSFIGMQQAILLGNDFYEKKNIKPDIIFASATTRAITTALLAFRNQPRENTIIYVSPYISEALVVSTDTQNKPVHSSILKRMFGFIKDWMEEKMPWYIDDIEFINNSKKFSDYIYIRNVKREDLSLKKIEERAEHSKRFEVVLKSFLNTPEEQELKRTSESFMAGLLESRFKIKEIFDYLYWHTFSFDKIFKEEPKKDDVRRHIWHNKVMRFIRFYVNSDHFKNMDNPEEITRIAEYFEKISNRRYFRGPKIDFSILEEFEKSGKQLFDPTGHKTTEYYNKFYEEIIQYAITNNLNDIGTKIGNGQSIIISCISHGKNMRTYFSEKYKRPGIDYDNEMGYDVKKYKKEIQNTHTFKEIIYVNDPFNMNKRSLFKTDEFVPRGVRSTYYNFEALNEDICRAENVKGIINYALWDSKTERNMIPYTFNYYMPNIASKFHNPDYYADPSVSDYYNKNSEKHYEKYYTEEKYKAAVLEGGSENYRKKYLKYKSKYLSQKKLQ